MNDAVATARLTLDSSGENSALPAGTKRSEAEYVSLGHLIRKFLRSWPVILVCILSGLLLAGTYLSTTTPTYEISAVIAPVADLTGTTDSAVPSSGGVASLGAIFGSRPSQVSRIDQFLLLLKSVRIAGRVESKYHFMHIVFPQDWNEGQQNWVKPAIPDFLTSVRWAFRRMLGRPEWTAPTVYDFANYLDGSIGVALSMPDRALPVYRLTVQSGDPAFAAKLLSAVIQETDAAAREIDESASQQRLAYLVRKLPQVANVDDRQALVGLLVDEERVLMATAPNQPYAVDLLDPVSASSRPTKPQPGLILAIGLLLGTVVGISIPIIRAALGVNLR